MYCTDVGDYTVGPVRYTAYCTDVGDYTVGPVWYTAYCTNVGDTLLVQYGILCIAQM